MKLVIRPIEEENVKVISHAFQRIGWHKPVSQYQRYFHEQRKGKRIVLVAWMGRAFAGYLTVVWRPDYPLFKKKRIPEVVDLNVLPRFRRKKIGTRLMNKAEGLIKKRSPLAGVGVGLAPGYEMAQKMYVHRGYVPDGLGVYYRNKPVKFGQRVVVGDDLVLHFTKELR